MTLLWQPALRDDWDSELGQTNDVLKTISQYALRCIVFSAADHFNADWVSLMAQ